jgi:hypothetical protein
MKRIRADRPRIRRERAWTEDPPADPRDPDVVRVKALARARPAGSSRASQAQQAGTTGPAAEPVHHKAHGSGEGSSVSRTPPAVAVHN